MKTQPATSFTPHNIAIYVPNNIKYKKEASTMLCVINLATYIRDMEAKPECHSQYWKHLKCHSVQQVWTCLWVLFDT